MTIHPNHAEEELRAMFEIGAYDLGQKTMAAKTPLPTITESEAVALCKRFVDAIADEEMVSINYDPDLNSLYVYGDRWESGTFPRSFRVGMHIMIDVHLQKQTVAGLEVFSCSQLLSHPVPALRDWWEDVKREQRDIVEGEPLAKMLRPIIKN